jgi:hypothetical protein
LPVRGHRLELRARARRTGVGQAAKEETAGCIVAVGLGYRLWRFDFPGLALRVDEHGYSDSETSQQLGVRVDAMVYSSTVYPEMDGIGPSDDTSPHRRWHVRR